MELIGIFVLALLGVIGAAMSTQLAAEFKAWTPWLIRRLIQRAVRQLPKKHRKRFTEEWQSHVNEIPGEVVKLIVAFGCLRASRKMLRGLTDDTSYLIASHWLAEAVYRGFEILVALTGLLAGLPLMLIAAAVIRCDSPGPVLFFHQRAGRSTAVRGRDLKGRTDLSSPPGGFEADRLYYVPSYFPLMKFRTMHADARTRFPHFYAYKYTPEEFRLQYPTI